MIPSRISKALRVVLDRLSGSRITWALTGSTRMALAGMALQPGDIDLQSDARGAYAIENFFTDCLVRSVRFTDSGHIRSHLGALEVEGVKVEIIGDVEKRLPDGGWTPKPDLPALIESLEWEGRRVPVLPLAYEADAYAKLGRAERAEQLRNFLAEHDNS
jgi:hypothetical protein